jgi:tetratricopeptide (TPR) repeat protein
VSAIEHAFELLRAGDPLGAEATAAQTVKDAASNHGPSSTAYAAAQFDLARLLLAMGDMRRAAACLREAVRVPSDSPESERDRLSYGMNLGEVLIALGELDEAQELLVQGLADRAAMYGTDHPGYAFGLAPIAQLHLKRGENSQARSAAQRAAKLLWDWQHPHLAHALVLLTAALVADGYVAREVLKVWPVEPLPADLRAKALQQALTRAELDPPAQALDVLDVVRARLVQAEGIGEPWVRATVCMTNLARLAHLPARRVKLFDELIPVLAATHPLDARIDALLGRSQAQSEANDAAGADADYASALALCREHGRSDLSSKVARNWGLLCAELGQHHDAVRHLDRAIADARHAKDDDGLGRALIARGVHAQHQDDPRQALGLLQSGLPKLTPEDPDALIGASHLEALRTGDGCGCGDMSEALSRALRNLVLPHVAPGLVHRLEYRSIAGQVILDLAREPTPDEREVLDRVLHQALTQLRATLNAR